MKLPYFKIRDQLGLNKKLSHTLLEVTRLTQIDKERLKSKKRQEALTGKVETKRMQESQY